MDKTPGNPWEM